MKKDVFILVVSLILGISLLTYPSSGNAGRRVIGKWIDSSMYINSVYTIYVEGGKTYLHRSFSDGSSGTFQIVKDTRTTDSTVYRDPRDPTGDYYVINKRGSLEIWDSMGLIVTMEPIK